MSEITGVSKVENKNTYRSSSAKKSSDNSNFSSYLGESKSMNDIFEEAAGKYAIPVDLLKAVGKSESNFNSDAVSRCGAQGVMQLMPATAKELGVTDSFDAEQNIMGGAKYISSLLKKYDGNTTLAVAAYNAGSGNVAKYDGIPPFTETQNYVKKVMNYYGQGNIEVVSSNNRISNSNNTTGTTGQVSTVTPASPVQRNLSFVLTGNTDSTSSGIDDLDELFSYEDYMKFIDLFLEDRDEEEEKETKEVKKVENKTNYQATEINYNASVMNLLIDQK